MRTIQLDPMALRKLYENRDEVRAKRRMRRAIWSLGFGLVTTLLLPLVWAATLWLRAHP